MMALGIRHFEAQTAFATALLFGVPGCGDYRPIAQSANPEAAVNDVKVDFGSGAPLPMVTQEWSQMTLSEKKAFMTQEVTPAMKFLFSTYDAKRFAKMNCETCHGPAPEKNAWAMPNPALPKLDPKSGFSRWQVKAPAAVKFMAEDVTPQMQRLLNLPAYDPSTGDGFGCMSCHTAK